MPQLRLIPSLTAIASYNLKKSFTKTLLVRVNRLPAPIISRNMCQNYDTSQARKIDITPAKVITFDTHAVVKSLTETGDFTLEQAENLTAILLSIMNSNVELQYRDLVTKAQQEIAVQQLMAHINAVKKDMVILEKSEFSGLKNDNEKQGIYLKQLENVLHDELLKLKGSIMLDQNLEKSRVKEDFSIMDKHVEKLNHKIETEVAKLVTDFEKYKHDQLKYMAGTVISCLTLCLGFYRMWMK